MRRFVISVVLLVLCANPGLNSLAGDLPDGFTYLEDVVPDIQLEIRYHSQDNFIGQRIDGYAAPKCIITKDAANALKKVQDELKAFGLGLKVYDAYRPQRAVAHFVRWAQNLDDTSMKSAYYPNVEKQNLFREGYIAQRSSHSRGSAVDLTIVALDAEASQELDMGSPWDFFGPRSWFGSLSVSPSQRAHRMLLQTLMIRHGFEPLPEEWWHFKLKDEPFPDQYFDFVVE